MAKSDKTSRRTFVHKTVQLVAAATAAAVILPGCKDDDEEKEVSPPEDLMQEHGLLNRILLIYDHCRDSLAARQEFNPLLLHNSASILRTFVEDYHEKQEEDYLFPRFEKAHTLVDLVTVLRRQHDAGRQITAQLLQLTNTKSLSPADGQQVIQLIDKFNTMYRPHEAREDTVLFPAFRKLVSQHEYDSLGEDFEKNEQKKFGKDGFETMVEKIATLERQLGIYELAQFTPTV